MLLTPESWCPNSFNVFLLKFPEPWGDYDTFTVYMCDAHQTPKALLKVMTETKHLIFLSGLCTYIKNVSKFTHEHHSPEPK